MAKGWNGERQEPTFDAFPESQEGPRRRPPKKRKSKKRPRRSILNRLVYWVLMLGVWGAVGASLVVAYYAAQLPPIDQLAIPKRPPNIAILAEDGTLLANRGDMGGAAVHLAELPSYLPKAFVAIEDRRFYDHWGIDPIGILRALVRDATSSRRHGRRLDADPAARQEPVPRLRNARCRAKSRKPSSPSGWSTNIPRIRSSNSI